MWTGVAAVGKNMADTAVRLFILFKINPGQLHAFKKLAEELTADTLATEPRTQSYEWYLTEDQTECWISERFLDSAALIEHNEQVSERFKILMQLADVKEVFLLGSPSPEVRARFAPIGAKVLESFSGFCR